MELITNLFPDLGHIFNLAFLFVFEYYGWVFFVIGGIYMMWRLYKTEIMIQHWKKQKWVYFQIKVPKDNKVSTLGVDNIYSQLHSLQVNKTFMEKYVEGQLFQLWYSLELVSLGGKVSYIARVPEKMRHNFEAAIYSQYPTAELTEVEDYMKNITYNPDNPGNMEIFGTEWKTAESDVIPIKTYVEFEHPTAEEKILDPLSHLLESLAKFEPHEFFGIQILAMPLSDEEWKDKSEAKVKELIGEEVLQEASFIKLLLKPFDWFAKVNYKESVLGKKNGLGQTEDELGRKQKNNWLSMTEAEKERVNQIQKKSNKPGYRCKIRFLYMAPKDKFDKSKAFMVVGAYRPFTAPFYNKIKPDVHNTWTHIDAYLSPTLEKPVLDWKLKYKKRWMFKGYKYRDWDIGLPMFILNTEELATLYHFPLTTESTTVSSYIAKTESKKTEAPVNLPIAE